MVDVRFELTTNDPWSVDDAICEGISPLGYWQKLNQPPTQTKPYNNMSPWVPRIWIEVWVGTYDRIRRPVNRYVPKIPPFQGGENVIRRTLGWVIDRSFTPVVQ